MDRSIFWFRRDLRLEDNAGLYHALKSGDKVQCVFIFDKSILHNLSKEDPRVSFIHQEILRLSKELESYGSSLITYAGTPLECWRKICEDFLINSVYTNADYEPYSKIRDSQVENYLSKKGIHLHKYKDHVIFESHEVTKDDGSPYTVFSPYKRKWLAKLDNKTHKSYYLSSYPTIKYRANFIKQKKSSIHTLDEIGFVESQIPIPSKKIKRSIIKMYDQQRDFPSINGTSKLGVHFRFGTLSIREKARHALKLNSTFLSELIWREFYSQILDKFPHVVDGPFRKKYKNIEWRTNENDFNVWKNGMTGYPLVDAGMRELNATGFMHNRVRMVAASFLTKHLLLPWSWGEAYFAEKLLDFDLASNNGGWQWASGTGTDAAPYFRIFNPKAQLLKFDKDLKYVKKWIPELETELYPKPIVDHKYARERCLATFKNGLGKA